MDDTREYYLARRKSQSLSSVAEHSSPPHNMKMKRSSAVNITEMTHPKRRSSSAGCSSQKITTAMSNPTRGRSVDEIADDLQLKEFKESPSYFHRRRSLSLGNIATFGDHLETIRGGKKKNVIQVVQHSISNFKHRGWKGKSNSLGGIYEPTISSSSSVHNEAHNTSTHQRTRSKSLFSKGNHKNLRGILKKEVTKEEPFVVQNEWQTTVGYSKPSEVDLNALISKLESLEGEEAALRCKSLELQQTWEEVMDQIRDKTEQTKHLKNRLDHQLRQWDDFTELHQNEVKSKKSHAVHALERIESVEYRFQRQTADLEEDIQKCETIIIKMEKRQEERANDLIHGDGNILISKFIGVTLHLIALFFTVIRSIACHKKCSLIVIFVAFTYFGLWIMYF